VTRGVRAERFSHNTTAESISRPTDLAQIATSRTNRRLHRGMASIQHLQSRRTGRVSYRAQVRLRGHPSQSGTFRNRKDAERWASSLECGIREGRYFPNAAARRTTFAALTERYGRSVLIDARPERRSNARHHIAWWLSQFGTLSLAEITADHIAQSRDALASQTYVRAKASSSKNGTTAPATYKRSGATVNRYLSTLSHIFATAVREWRLIDKNPVAEVRKKKESRGRARFLRDEERDALLVACAHSAWPPLQTLVLLAISTGARRSELIHLKWTDISLGLPTPGALVQRTKNGDSRRLPLVGKTLESLRALEAAKGGAGRFVFAHPSRIDKPYTAFDAHWYAALSSARIDDFRFHDLRHTCASYLAAQGSSLLEIADVLGHRTMAMVKRYSHLAEGHKVIVIARMARERGL
jgi:integrase